MLDSDKNGKVDKTDIDRLKQRGDVNGDGKTDMQDLQAAKDKIRRR